MTTFCAEQGISRKTFYVLRRRAPGGGARGGGRAPVAPCAMPARAACPIGFAPGPSMCARLRGRSGLDHGPISARRRGWPPWALRRPRRRPWPGIYRSGGGGAGPNRPRDRGRRGAGSTCPAPNACWQLDATEYVLAGGRKAVIFRLQDDHWRLAVAWLVAPGDGRPGGHRRLRQGRSRPGRAPAPARPTTARPRAPAGAQSPAAWWSTCAPWASNLSPANPTGPPPRARTSASARPCSATWTSSPWPTPSPSPPGRRVDRFDRIYNTQRPHQGLPGRITGQQAWKQS